MRWWRSCLWTLSLTGRQDILDQLVTRLKRYLIQYRVLSELSALQVFFVNVEATFSAPQIREDLVSLGIAWTEEDPGEPVELFVRVKGVASVRSYQELIQLFRKMANVKAATPYEVFGTSVVLRLEYEGGLEDLVEAISDWRSDEFAFRVDQVNDREISVSLVTRGDQPMELVNCCDPRPLSLVLVVSSIESAHVACIRKGWTQCSLPGRDRRTCARRG